MLYLTFFGLSGSGSGFLRIGALLQALALLVAFLATIPTFRGGFPLPVLVASTPPVSEGFGIVVGITTMPSSLLPSDASILHRLASSATTTGPISLRVQHLVVFTRTHRRTHVVLLYKEHRL